MLGRDGFRKGMDLYFERHDGAGGDGRGFRRLLRGRHRPRPRAVHALVLAGRHAGARLPSSRYDKTKKAAELTSSRCCRRRPARPTKKPLHIPLRLGLLGGNGQDIALKLAAGEEPSPTASSQLTKRARPSASATCPRRPVPSLLRGFSAPVNLTLDLSDADLEFLMANDSDLFNRWQAAKTYATRMLVEAVAQPCRRQEVEPAACASRAPSARRSGDGLEPAYRAELLKLPSEADIARDHRHATSTRRSSTAPTAAS